ncbi:UPF0598 protein CG30010 [Cephus cinctus]|uniref:UPF0598 protein CG30010 n=1 Tax=Cephus cinctus TaxID=211228 RepID=A0AAJ7VZY0_CEPCN|nr:UPF0598 protein CG30010 [Cephus cinctus]XP_024939394.1 UPF0598 protein CG30010 [Cephus cinctus]
MIASLWSFPIRRSSLGTISTTWLSNSSTDLTKCLRRISYVQGQFTEHRVREYFYYIDHQGMLFLDDARMKNFTSCFKEKKFLAFFFQRLKKNDTGRYSEEFPYLSICGKEHNFIRCDDVPIVFTRVLEKQSPNTGEIYYQFGYAHAEELLSVPFEPDKIYMNINTGRIYHPAPDKAGGIGLIISKLAIEFSTFFEFENRVDDGPTHFTFNGKRYKFDTEWYQNKIVLGEK